MPQVVGTGPQLAVRYVISAHLDVPIPFDLDKILTAACLWHITFLSSQKAMCRLLGLLPQNKEHSFVTVNNLPLTMKPFNFV